MAGLKGQALALEALRVYRLAEARYPSGITIAELEYELRIAGVRIESDNDVVALRSALNASIVKGIWRLVDVGMWLPANGVSKTETGLAGKPLAAALHDFVRVTYPDHEFHYERAREALERTGVKVKGTGSTTRASLVGAPDRFTPVVGKRGYWRWK
ncbi:MAG: hypothetical protein IVW53_06265 [Chloroflexi bacterium]|nr:hypothetical protein [Chloroflexota bacterium]